MQCWLLASKLFTRNIKLRLYLTLIRHVVTYGAETWAATESELQKLLIFERKFWGKFTAQLKTRKTGGSEEQNPSSESGNSILDVL